LHSISAINVLRSYNLPRADFRDPASVLKELNAIFQMEDHNNMFMTMWYGVYDKETKQIQYASGGHPPAILITGPSADKSKIYELKTPGIVIGAFPDSEFVNATCQVEEFNRLFVFSDGVFEITRLDDSVMTFTEFEDLLFKSPPKEEFELGDLLDYLQKVQGKEVFVDDFSLLQISFER